MLPDHLPLGNQFAFWRDLAKRKGDRYLWQRNGNKGTATQYNSAFLIRGSGVRVTPGAYPPKGQSNRQPFCQIVRPAADWESSELQRFYPSFDLFFGCIEIFRDFLKAEPRSPHLHERLVFCFSPILLLRTHSCERWFLNR